MALAFETPACSEPECRGWLVNQSTVGILIFDGVEVLDFAGPYEVFSRTRLEPGTESRRSDESAPFRVFTFAEGAGAVVATGGLRVLPDFDFATVPRIELLVIPGGFGTRPMLQDQAMLEWIRRAAAAATRVASVCTGALVLAKAGLLAGRRATTHWGALATLVELDPTIRVDADARVVEDVIYTSAGVSAGIDMAFAVVEAMHGRTVADETARYMDYPRRDGHPSSSE
jgi:transcriptional regulator GlxA family with amidase domain